MEKFVKTSLFFNVKKWECWMLVQIVPYNIFVACFTTEKVQCVLNTSRDLIFVFLNSYHQEYAQNQRPLVWTNWSKVVFILLNFSLFYNITYYSIYVATIYYRVSLTKMVDFWKTTSKMYQFKCSVRVHPDASSILIQIFHIICSPSSPLYETIFADN